MIPNSRLPGSIGLKIMCSAIQSVVPPVIRPKIGSTMCEPVTKNTVTCTSPM
jgi:hypothetical protein